MKLVNLSFRMLSVITIIYTNSFANTGYHGGNPYYELFSIQKRQFVGVNTQKNILKGNYGQGQIATVKHELFGNIKTSDKSYLLLNVPYKTIDLETSSGTISSKTGLSDINATFLYQIKNTIWDSTYNGSWRQQILLGGGVKSPTGGYTQLNSENDIINAVTQLGTGSWDYLLAANYTAKNQDFGLNFDFQYLINTANNYQYQLGNKLSHKTNVFYSINSKNTSLITRIGSHRSYFDDNINHGVSDPNSGGWLWAATAGIDIYHKNIGLNIGYQQPLNQVLVNNQYKVMPSSNVGIMWLF